MTGVSKCITVPVLLGRNNNYEPCHAVHLAFSAIITTALRIILLVFLLNGSNSIIVQLLHNPIISGTCEILTVVTSAEGFSSYQASRLEPETFFRNISEIEGYLMEGRVREKGSLYYKYTGSGNESSNQEYLFGVEKSWLTFRTDDDGVRGDIHSFDDDGYRKYYYYCGDMSGILNTSWIPVLAWIVVNIFPVIFLAICVLLFTLRSNFVVTCFTNPGLILASVFSHFHVGPVTFSKNYITRSLSLTFLNIFLTFLGMCLTIHLVTAAFGPGDGAHLRYVITILVPVPIFLISAGLASCYLLPCKSHSQRLVFNPADPGQWYRLDNQDNLVPLHQQLGINNLPSDDVEE